MAKGGEIKPFCSSSQFHNPACEYFAEGGQVPLDVKSLGPEKMLFGEPTDQEKWAQGLEDKQGTVATALLHSGATHLLAGTMKGAYGPNQLDAPMAETHSHPLAQALAQRMSAAGQNEGFGNLIHYVRGAQKGSKQLETSIESLFSGGKSPASLDEDSDHDRLAQYIQDGTFQDQLNQALRPPGPQAFAKGGEVAGNPLGSNANAMEQTLPDHNMMIASAKARVNNYLNSLRPVEQVDKKPFDTVHESPEKKRTYQKALKLANQPGRILDHIKSGTLTAEQVSHFTSLYPEVHDHMTKKLTERIVKHQQQGHKKPPYSVRQGLSLFMGASLDSSFLPEYIQAAQAVFQGQAAQKQQASQMQNQKKTTGSKAKLDNTSKAYLTPDQSAISRQQRAK